MNCPRCGKQAKVRYTFHGLTVAVRKRYCTICGIIWTLEQEIPKIQAKEIIKEVKLRRKGITAEMLEELEIDRGTYEEV